MLLPGRVVDFSLTGMRIRLPLTWKAGMQRRVRLYAAGVRLDFVGKAIWSRRDGRLNHIVGVAFQRLTPQDDAVLADLLARHGVEAPTTVSAAA